MTIHADKVQENRSQSVANAVSQLKSSSNKSTFQFVDNRPEAIMQRKIENITNNYKKESFCQLEDNRLQAIIQNKLQRDTNNCSQLNYGKIYQFDGKERPSFSGPARRLIDRVHPYKVSYNIDYDMAHKLSFRDIKHIVSNGTDATVKDLIDKMTVPKRDFGNYKKGWTGLKDEAMALFNSKPKKTDELIRLLNNCPFNLRPGQPSANRSIGSGFDGNVTDSGLDSPHTKSLRPFATTDTGATSSFMGDADLHKMEKIWYAQGLFK